LGGREGEVRAARVYLGGAGTLAAVLVGTALLQAWVRSLDLERRPTAVESALLTVSLWSTRALPFVVIAAALASPFLILPLAWLVREGRSAKAVNGEPLLWCFIGAVSWMAAMAIAWRDGPPMAGALFFWSGSLSWALSIAVAYRVQKRLHADGRSRVSGGTLLGMGLLLSVTLWATWACILVAGLPAWVEWRRRPTRG
jgi:hypothetical protein